MSQLDFTVDVFQNEYLPGGSRDVNAIVTVTSADGPAGSSSGSRRGRVASARSGAGSTRSGAGSARSGAGSAGTGGPSIAEIIIIDCSGSMSAPASKMAEARAATAAAVDVIRDGVAFAVVAGTQTAWPVFPPEGSMALADAASRQAATKAAAGLSPSGGTAIGQWPRLARQIFTGGPGGPGGPGGAGSHPGPAQVRHAILLTDGKNQHETPEQLDATLADCEGVFTCDCRGVGPGREPR